MVEARNGRIPPSTDVQRHFQLEGSKVTEFIALHLGRSDPEERYKALQLTSGMSGLPSREVLAFIG